MKKSYFRIYVNGVHKRSTCGHSKKEKRDFLEKLNGPVNMETIDFYLEQTGGDPGYYSIEIKEVKHVKNYYEVINSYDAPYDVDINPFSSKVSLIPRFTAKLTDNGSRIVPYSDYAIISTRKDWGE